MDRDEHPEGTVASDRDEPIEGAKPNDRVRDTLLRRAAACLDHVRAVRWGEAQTSYTVDDGDMSIDVVVRVCCVRAAVRGKGTKAQE